jgi:hypothetical protein
MNALKFGYLSVKSGRATNHSFQKRFSSLDVI